MSGHAAIIACSVMRLELLAVIGDQCYIETGLDDSAKLKARALENCRAFRKEYLEIRGTLEYLRRWSAAGTRTRIVSSICHQDSA